MEAGPILHFLCLRRYPTAERLNVPFARGGAASGERPGSLDRRSVCGSIETPASEPSVTWPLRLRSHASPR